MNHRVQGHQLPNASLTLATLAGQNSTDPPGESDPINLRLYRRLVALIVAGHWQAGARLPSSRALAADLHLSRSTAALAIERLVADGWAEARPRSGVFVSRAAPTLPVSPIGPESAPGSPPVPLEIGQGAVDCFPAARWARIQSRIWAGQMPNALYDASGAGDAGLRASLARLLALTRSIQCSPDDLLVVSSTQAALTLTAATLAGQVGEAIVESPGYPLGWDALGAAGLTIRPCRVDDEGIQVAEMGADAPSLVFLTPAAQFPNGAELSPHRRAELQRWVAVTSSWLFEDDYDWDSRFDEARPPPPLKAGPLADRTFYCQSFNRTLFPSLRLAMLVVPPALRQRAMAVRERIDGYVNLPNQLVLREFIDSGAYAAHLRALRAVHRERRQALIELFEPYFGTVFDGTVNAAGFRIVLRPVDGDARAIAIRLREEGVMCVTLSDLSASAPPEDGVVLGFAAFAPAAIAALWPMVERALRAG